MKLNQSSRYIFLRRDASGAESIGVREWNGRWKTRRHPTDRVSDYGRWRVIRSDKPLWRGGPRMVLEVPA